MNSCLKPTILNLIRQERGGRGQSESMVRSKREEEGRLRRRIV